MTNWIPVSERLPDDGKRVLCSCDGHIFIGYLLYNYWIVEGKSLPVKAWQPLPEPYKGE